MKPGDMIEWVYSFDNKVVIDKDEKLWSTPMKKWVPISVPALLISVTEDEYTWLSEKGVFRGHMDDMGAVFPVRRAIWVVPRVCG